MIHGYLDGVCRQAFSIKDNMACAQGKCPCLCVGKGVCAYLFFDIPPAAFQGRLLLAKLVLFKMPQDSISNGVPAEYTALPSLDFAGVYGGFAPPRGEVSLANRFSDVAQKGYAEADVTLMAQAWLSGQMENRGLLLQGEQKGVYASVGHEQSGMRPFLRLFFQVTPPLSVAPCTVLVK